MKVNSEFDIEDIVYLKTDVEQLPHIIVSFEVFKGGEIVYKILQKSSASYHYGFEMSREVDIALKTNN